MTVLVNLIEPPVFVLHHRDFGNLTLAGDPTLFTYLHRLRGSMHLRSDLWYFDGSSR